jgi:hypothetical protein
VLHIAVIGAAIAPSFVKFRDIFPGVLALRFFE